MSNLALEEKAQAKMKGTIPTLSLPTLKGTGWDDLRAMRYETIDYIVKAQDIKLFNTGRVSIKGIEKDFKLTPFAATGFAWCSGTADRACESDDAANLVTEAFQAQDKEYRLRATEGGTIITIVSPGYYPLKNSELIDGLVRLEPTMDSEFFYLSPYKTSIAIKSKKKFKMAKEEMFAGALVSNGEHGKKSFETLARMVQYICGNGAVIGSGTIMDMTRRHTNGDNNWEGFDVVGAVSEVINNVTGVQGIIEHLEDFSLRVEKTKQDTMKKIIQLGELGARQAEALPISYDAQRALRGREKGESMYDVFNAVTGLKDYFPKSKPQWEELGGQLFLDPKRFYGAELN